MGSFCSKAEVNDVERELIVQQMKALCDFKILVLGAGESGKSTVVKQIRLVHKGKSFTKEELERFRDSLIDNVVDCCKSFTAATVRFGYEWDDEEDRKTAEMFLDVGDEQVKLEQEMGERLVKLYKSKAVTQTMARRDQFWILDSIDYYFEHLERFLEPDFVPNEEDCVMARVRSTGIVTTEFDQPNQESKNEYDKTIHWRVIDVGGQRNERKKWIHFFDDVKAILFVVNLAGYDLVLFEDDTQNRMHEALELFTQIVNKPHFRQTPVFLFLNKKDLFEQQIRKVGLEKCFDDYKGDNSVQNAMDFVAQKFRSRMPAGNDQFQASMIASRLKADVKFAFAEMKKYLLELNAFQLASETKKMAKLAKG